MLKTLAIIIALILSEASANKDVEMENFVNGLVERYSEFMCDSEYLKCLNKQKSECRKSVKAATYKCPIDEFYKTTIPDERNDESQIEELRREAYLFGECVSSEFSKRMNLTEGSEVACEKHFPALGPVK